MLTLGINAAFHDSSAALLRDGVLTAAAEEVATLLEQDEVIGWMQGRMECGPRALGARSILASPLDELVIGRFVIEKQRT